MNILRTICVYLCLIGIMTAATTVSAQPVDNPLYQLFKKAIESFESKDYDRAVAYFEQAIRMNPNFGPAYNYLSLAYKQKGADEQIVENILITGTRMAPDYAPSFDNLGKIYYSRGDYEQAAEYTGQAIKINPQLASARMSMAWIELVGNSDPDAAIPHFEMGLKKITAPNALFGLGVSYAMTGKRLQVMDMITQLRAEGRDDFATELEMMIRDSRYVPPVARPRAKKAKAPEKSVLIEDHAFDVGAEVPVRLKHSSPQLSDTSSLGHQKSDGLSASERIRQLRQKSATSATSTTVTPSGGLGMPKGSSGY